MLTSDDYRPTLTGSKVRLEPLDMHHVDELWEAITPGDITGWFPVPIRSRDAMAAFVTEAIRQRDAGTAVPFATIELASGRAVGSSRFGNIQKANRVVEIGWTFLAAPFQRSGMNREAKLLQLTHAFEVWGCNRVEFKTDSLNRQSRTALAGIGAVEEGTFRNHVICEDGRLRHSVWFSIIREDWPVCRSNLQTRSIG
jgi:RimJ/RimL family protein N-acetyltransferase